jgi:hypothetical protein
MLWIEEKGKPSKRLPDKWGRKRTVSGPASWVPDDHFVSSFWRDIELLRNLQYRNCTAYEASTQMTHAY